MTNAVNNDYGVPENPNQKKNEGQNTLGQDAFLKILLTQLQNQDPLNPMEDKDFIAQMATFSSLEQLTNINKTLEVWKEGFSQSNLLAFTDFVGKEVTWHKIEGEESETGQPIIKEGKGVVASVQYLGDTVRIILEDGTELAPANISELKAASGGNPLLEASHLIGRTVSWMDNEQNERSGTVHSVTMKNGVLSLLLEDQTALNIDQITKIL
ncbi:flagellar hook assembly protein FlgD [Siminovitchia sp. 179-K 8D1 HS]|uniref:flagellar hook assembly protein FlgD n=1 Tax=Siminovitchia sp. 179-K 8D1 HS TaxID=3142385 RepID=UPI0039A3D69C